MNKGVYIRCGGAVLLTIGSILFAACEENPATPGNPNPEEEVTTVRLLLRNEADPLDTTSAAWRDLDGPGGTAPVVDTLRLKSGASYRGSIVILNEKQSPADTVSNEVYDERNAHQFFYEAKDGVAGRMTITKLDLDTNTPPLPVGLDYRVVVSAGGAATGRLNVLLSHYDAVPKSSSPGPESDIDIDLPVVVR